MSLVDVIWYFPLCLGVVFVWAGTREEEPRAIIRHALGLFVRATVGLLAFCLAIQVLLAIG